MPENKISWLTCAKGAGIVLVVIGHVFHNSSHILLQNIGSLIFLFHMPLFFMLSGFLFIPVNMHELARKRQWSLLMPYFIFLMLLSIPAIKWSLQTQTSPETLKLLGRTLYGGVKLTGWTGVFWFVTCLFLTQIIYNLILLQSPERNPANKRVILIILCFAIGGEIWGYLPVKHTLPWALELVPVALIFFWAGHILRHANPGQRVMTKSCLAIIIFSAMLACGGFTPTFDMKYSNFGFPIIGLLLAFSLSYLFIRLCQFAAQYSFPNIVLSTFGNASLVIMFLHQAIHLSLRDKGFDYEFAIVVLALGVPCACYEIAAKSALLSKYLLGQRKSQVIKISTP